MESAMMASATTEGGGRAAVQEQIRFNQIITNIRTSSRPMTCSSIVRPQEAIVYPDDPGPDRDLDAAPKKPRLPLSDIFTTNQT